jgi:hypothetical protein
MVSDDDLIPLEDWTALQRSRAISTVDLAVEFIEKDRIDEALELLRALAYRLDVDQSVEEYFFQCEKLEGGKYFEVCQ